MKKIFLCFFLVFFLSGCARSYATEPVRDYLNKFRNSEEEVTIALNELLRQENLLAEQEELYRLIMKKQYVDLEYKIVSEKYNRDHAEITVELTVYDYEQSRIDAEREMQEHKNEYEMTDGSINKEKYFDLQLNYMKKEKRRVKYTVNFDVNLQGEIWVLENPTREVIEKIHGLYRNKED